jgi:hypothetical protein
LTRRDITRFVAYCLVLGQVAFTASCHQTIDGGGGSGSTASGSVVAGILGSNDLGEAVYGLYHSHLQGETDPNVRAAEVSALEGHHADFVQAVNDIANARSLANGLQTAQSLFGLVDDGTLPGLAQDVSQLLSLLQQDQAAQAAILQLLQTPSTPAVIPADDFLALLGRLVNYDQTAQLWSATADLVNQNPQLVQNVLSLASRRLEAATPIASTGTLATAAQSLSAALLDPAQLRAQQSFGSPEWIVALDDRGNPQVSTDPSTNTFIAPFVDDGTGHAKVDGNGNFVDASGAPIAIAPFGPSNTAGYDGQGRAVSGSGLLEFAYLDAKSTILGLGLKLGGDLLRDDAHEHLDNVLEAALGPQKSDGSYNDGPVPDLAYGGLQLLAPDESLEMIRALATLLANDPGRAERLLVALGHAIDDIQSAQQASAQAGGLGSLSLSDPKVVQLTDDILPMVDDVFTSPAAGGASTGRVLIGVLQGLSTSAPGWPSELAPLFIMHRIQPAAPVDYSHDAVYTDSSGSQVDNRSSIHQLLDLLATADGCQVPLLNESLAQLIMDTMAGLTPQTVANLTSLVTAMPGFLQNLLCAGVSNDMSALDDLAKSGSLDALLPIAKAFKDQGQTELLVKLLVRVDQSYSATMRPIEPDVEKFLTSGAVDELAALLGETTTIQDPTTGRSLADIVASGAAAFVNQHSSNVVDRHGNKVPSLAYLLLDPLRALDSTLRNANASQDLTTLASSLEKIALARTTDPTTGQEVLANGCTVPFAQKVLEAFVDSVPADAATRQSDLTTAEQSIATFVLSSDMGTLMTLGRTILNASSRPLIDAALVNLLTPNTNDPQDIFGAVVKLAAIVLEHVKTRTASLGASPQAVADLENFLGQALDPSKTFVQDAINAVSKLLEADQGQTILNVQRAALNPPPGSTVPPAAVLVHVIEDVQTAASQAGGGSGPISAQDFSDAIATAIAWIDDQQHGLGFIFSVIKNRQK